MCSIDETQECCDQASNPDQFFDPRSPNIARTPIEVSFQHSSFPLVIRLICYSFLCHQIEVENASQCSQKSLQVAYCSKMGHVFDFSSLGIAACSTPAPNVLALPSEEKFDFSSLILAASTTTTRPTTNDIVDENGGPSSYLSLLKKAPSSRSRVPLGDSNHLALALSHLQYRTNRGI